MTMFSMKPRFDLAAFLATPAPAGAARAAGARRRGMQFQSAPVTEDAAKATPSDDTSAKE